MTTTANISQILLDTITHISADHERSGYSANLGVMRGFDGCDAGIC